VEEVEKERVEEKKVQVRVEKERVEEKKKERVEEKKVQERVALWVKP